MYNQIRTLQLICLLICILIFLWIATLHYKYAWKNVIPIVVFLRKLIRFYEDIHIFLISSYEVTSNKTKPDFVMQHTITSVLDDRFCNMHLGRILEERLRPQSYHLCTYVHIYAVRIIPTYAFNGGNLK